MPLPDGTAIRGKGHDTHPLLASPPAPRTTLVQTATVQGPAPGGCRMKGLGKGKTKAGPPRQGSRKESRSLNFREAQTKGLGAGEHS